MNQFQFNTKFDEIQKHLLMEVADLHAVPEGAYNIYQYNF